MTRARRRRLALIAAVALVGCRSWTFEPKGETYSARERPAEYGDWGYGDQGVRPPGLELIGTLRCWDREDLGEASRQAARHGGDYYVPMGIGSETGYDADYYSDRVVYTSKDVFCEEFDVYRSAGADLSTLSPAQQASARASKAYYTDDDYRGAVRHANQCLELEPDNALALELRALAYTKLGKQSWTEDRDACLVHACEDFERLLEAQPDNVDYAKGLFEAARLAGRQDAMDRAFALTIADPGLSVHDRRKLHTERARRREDQGDPGGAIEDLTAAVALEPSYHLPYTDRAEIEARTGDLASALADYSQGIAAMTLGGGFRLECLRARAAVRLTLGDAAGALADLDRVVLEAPRWSRLQRGLVHLQMGHGDQAQDDFRVVDRDLTEALVARGMASMLAGKPAEAEAHWAPILDPAPDVGGVDTQRGRWLIARFLAAAPDHALRDPDRAIQLAATDDPEPDPLQLATLAAACAAQGDFERAVGVQRQVEVGVIQVRARDLHRERAERYARGEDLTLTPWEVIFPPQALWPQRTFWED